MSRIFSRSVFNVLLSNKYSQSLRWVNRTCSRFDVVDAKFASKGRENAFAFEIVKTAGISKISNTYSFPVIDQIINSNGVENVSTEIAKFSDEELVAFLDRLEPLTKMEYFPELWKIVDLEGSKRIPFGNPSVVLAGAMKIYEMKLSWRSEWLWSCLKRFCRRLDRLNKSEMLQVMFLVNIIRKIPQQCSGFDVHYHLVKHFDDLDVNEMALVSIAFFKSQTKMHNKVIMSKVMRKVIEEGDSIPGLSLAMISKIIRYSLPVTLADELYVMQSQLTKDIHRIELQSLTHLALSGSSVLVYNKPFIQAIVEKMKENVSEIRLKDMERILHVMSLFYHKDNEFVKKIVEELDRRDEEIEAFPTALVALLNFLMILEEFPLDLIDRVLSTKFLKESYGESLRKIGNNLIFIDKSVEIERPEYAGNRLSSKVMNQSAKILRFTVKTELTGTQKFSYELEAVLKQIYGKNNVKFMAVLPQYHFSDLVMGFDENLKQLQIPRDWSVHRWGEIKQPPDVKNVWLVVLVGGWNTNTRNTNEPLGLMMAKMRQLRILGYHPILIPYNRWRQSTDKVTLMKNWISNELEHIYGQNREKKIV